MEKFRRIARTIAADEFRGGFGGGLEFGWGNAHAPRAVVTGAYLAGTNRRREARGGLRRRRNVVRPAISTRRAGVGKSEESGNVAADGR